MSEEQSVDIELKANTNSGMQIEMTEDFVSDLNEIEAKVEAETEQSEISIPESQSKTDDGDITVIPDRVYFRIGDVAEITGIKPYVLRFWEKEFDLLKPVKNNSGQRIFRKKDVESVLLIKRLLYRERYSIEGAKKRIKELRKQKKLGTEKRKRGELDETKLEVLANIRSGLNELIQLASR